MVHKYLCMFLNQNAVIKNKAVKSHTVYGVLYRARNYAVFLKSNYKMPIFWLELQKHLRRRKTIILFINNICYDINKNISY